MFVSNEWSGASSLLQMPRYSYDHTDLFWIHFLGGKILHISAKSFHYFMIGTILVLLDSSKQVRFDAFESIWQEVHSHSGLSSMPWWVRNLPPFGLNLSGAIVVLSLVSFFVWMASLECG